MALSGKVALVTGGVKNLGAEIALQLASEGSDLALHFNSANSLADAKKLKETLEKARSSIKVNVYQGDLTTASAVDKLFASVLKDFGKIDIVINTVGKVLKKPITDITEQEYDSMFA